MILGFDFQAPESLSAPLEVLFQVGQNGKRYMQGVIVGSRGGDDFTLATNSFLGLVDEPLGILQAWVSQCAARPKPPTHSPRLLSLPDYDRHDDPGLSLVEPRFR